MSYAVVLSDRTDDISGVLVMLDDKGDAEQIAIEMRLRGHEVEVRRVSDSLSGRAPSRDAWS
jgi:hypothetical protein